MAYNQELEKRLIGIASHWPGVASKKMFGGMCLLMNGNMVCGVINDNLILRLGTDVQQFALQKPSVVPFDITGKPMKGWVMVEPAGYSGSQLEAWVDLAHQFVLSLPPK
jgi:TfoX/Sxy family transcriptional regulator of competence genes